MWGLWGGPGHMRGGCPARRATGRPRGRSGWAADFTSAIFTIAIFTIAVALQSQPPIPRAVAARSRQPWVWRGGEGCGLLGHDAERSRSAPVPSHGACASAALPVPRGRCRPHAGRAAVLWRRGWPWGRRPARHTLARCPWGTSWLFQGGGFSGAVVGRTLGSPE